MRILLASDHFPPFIGGAHRWAALLATGLARRGHDVTVATVWHGHSPRVEHHGEEQVPVHRVRQLRTAGPWLGSGDGQRHAPPFPDPVTVRDLRRVLTGTRPDVVLVHGWLASSVAAAMRGSDTPLVLSAHDYGYFCATRTLLHDGRPCSGPAPRKCLECASGYYGRLKGVASVAGVAASRPLLAGRATAVQSVTTFVDTMNAEFLLRDPDGSARRRFVVPAFVEMESPQGPEVEAIIPQLPQEPFILFVGALRPLKGIEVLFDAYRRLEQPPPLVLLGTIERDTPDPVPAGATVLTDVPHPAVMAAWDRAMIGVVPSIWPEPLGTVSVEGISRGLPVIATTPGGMVDVVGDGVGVLVPAGDAAALAEAMRSLIDSPQRRAELSERGRRHAVAFEAEAVLTRYEEMLAQVVVDGAAG